MGKISISVMCIDYRQIRYQIEKLNSFTDYFHFDIMDGHYVPNFTLNFDMIDSLGKIIKKPIDVHLMVSNPEIFLPRLYSLSINSISFHLNTIENQAFRIIRQVKGNNIKVGIVLNPIEKVEILEYLFNIIDKVVIMTVDPGFAGQKFIPEMVEKIKKLKKIKDDFNYHFEIEVDGHVNKNTISSLIDAGADVFILGKSGLFSLDNDIEEAIKKAKRYIPFLN